MNLLNKKNKNLKIGIAVPCRDQVHSLFTFSLANLIQTHAEEDIKTKLYMLSGSLIADQRHKLALSCIMDHCTHILWLDSDMMFPDDIAIKLLSHKKPIVACNYSTRAEPRKSVAYKTIGDWENWLNSKNETSKLSQVAAVGMGCMLTDCRIFSKMSAPYFEVQYDEALREWIGEDFYFCKKSQDLGYDIFIDNQSSMNVYHLGLTAYQNQTL